MYETKILWEAEKVKFSFLCDNDYNEYFRVLLSLIKFSAAIIQMFP